MPWIPDSRYCIPVFVGGTWILDSNRQRDSGFLKLYSGFQRPGFQIPRQKFAKFRIPQAKVFRITLHGARNRQDSGSENVSKKLK